MWAPDDFPGADSVPWPLLIRARYAHEIDAVIASRLVGRLAPALGLSKAVRLAEVARVQRSDEPATAEMKVNALSAIADWEDGEICPRNWPRGWPPKRRGFEELDDPLVSLALEASLEVIRAASPSFQEQVGAMVKEITTLG